MRYLIALVMGTAGLWPMTGSSTEAPPPEVVFELSEGEILKNVQTAVAPDTQLVIWTEADRRSFRGMLLDHENAPLTPPFDVSAHGAPVVNSFNDVTNPNLADRLVLDARLVAHPERNEFLVAWTAPTINPDFYNWRTDRRPGHELLARRIALGDDGALELGEIHRASWVDNDMHGTSGGAGSNGLALAFDPVRDAYLAVFDVNLEFQSEHGYHYLAATLLNPDGSPMSASVPISPTDDLLPRFTAPALAYDKVDDGFVAVYTENIRQHVLLGQRLAIHQYDAFTIHASPVRELAHASSPSVGLIQNYLTDPSLLIDGDAVWIAYSDDTGRKLSAVRTDRRLETVSSPMVLRSTATWRLINQPVIGRTNVDDVYVIQHIESAWGTVKQSLLDARVTAGELPELGPITTPQRELQLAHVPNAASGDTSYFAYTLGRNGHLINHFAQRGSTYASTALGVQPRRIVRDLDVAVDAPENVSVTAGDIAYLPVHVENRGGEAELTRLLSVAPRLDWTLPSSLTLSAVSGCTASETQSACSLALLAPLASTEALLHVDTRALECLEEPVNLSIGVSGTADQTADPEPANNSTSVNILVQPLAERPAHCGGFDDVEPLPGPGSEAGKANRQKACENNQRKGRGLPAPICHN